MADDKKHLEQGFIPVQPPDMVEYSGAVKSYLAGDEDTALAKAKRAYGMNKDNMYARQLITRVSFNKGGAKRVRREFGER